MKILHIFPYLPTPPTFGGALRVYHILKHLSRHYEVSVAGFSEFGDMEKFRASFPELDGKMHFVNRKRVKYRTALQLYSQFTSHSYWYNWAQSPKLKSQIQSLLDKKDFDIVQAEFASMGHFDLQTDAVRVLDAHNVEYDNFRRMSTLEWSGLRKRFYQREYEKSFGEEIAAFKRQDALFVTSKRDGELIRKDVPKIPQFVIPNGVDTSYFTPGDEDEEPFSIVFTGAMSYVPNHDGMIYFLDDIFPIIKKRIPAAKVYIVGSNPPEMLLKRQSDSIIVTGFVDDVRPYVDRASVFVVPLRMGSGTRLKVVEALSMRKPVVSTSIGCEGIEVEDGEHIIIRDDPGLFAEEVIRLVQNKKISKQLVDRGYDLVKQKYDWQVIGESIDEAYQVLTNKMQMV